MQQTGSFMQSQQLPPGKLDHSAVLTLVAGLLGLTAIEILSLLVLLLISSPTLIDLSFYKLFFAVSFILVISMISSFASLFFARAARRRWQNGLFNESSLRLYRTGKFVGICGTVVNVLLMLAYLWVLWLIYL